MDQAESAITGSVRGAAAWVDRFLSNERSLAEENRSWVAFRLDASVREREGFDVSPRIRGRVVLPRTENRLHLAFGGRTDDSDDIADPATDVPADATQTDTQERDVALQVVLKRTRSNDIRPEAGVRIHELEPDPYAGVRWRHTEPLGTWELRATERLRAYADAGPESRTTIDFDHALSARLLFRTTTKGIWRDEEPGYVYGQQITLFQALDERTVLTYDWDNTFETEPHGVLRETAVTFRLSRRFARNRLLIEIAPRIAWSEELDYEPVLGLFLRAELSFGRGD